MEECQSGARTGKLVLRPAFKQTVAALRQVNVVLPRNSVGEDTDCRAHDFPAGRIVQLEVSAKFVLDPKRGEFLASPKRLLAAYDESINRFSALEGVAYF